MMVQQTSLLAYDDIKKDIGLRQRLVLKGFREIGCDASDREVASHLGFRDPNMVRPRRKELFDLGLLYAFSKRSCKITGKTVITWKVLKV